MNDSVPQAGREARRHHVMVEDPRTFSTSRIQRIRHDFHEHPLMSLAELGKLAQRLAPAEQCRFIRPGTAQDSEFNHTSSDPTGKSIAEVFARIEEPRSWIAMYNVEADPTYAGFLAEVAASVRPLVERDEPGMYNFCGFIFISSPPSVTPFHIDRENNFWLQIRGRKTMNVWDHRDREAVSAPAVDRFILNGTLGEVRLRDAIVARSHAFDVGPGDGVYFPATSPHMTSSEPSWTSPGNSVSISIGVVFYTSVTRRRARAHVANLALRKLGLAPRHPGESAWADRLKAPLGAALVKTMQVTQGFKPKPGF